MTVHRVNILLVGGPYLYMLTTSLSPSSRRQLNRGREARSSWAWRRAVSMEREADSEGWRTVRRVPYPSSSSTAWRHLGAGGRSLLRHLGDFSRDQGTGGGRYIPLSNPRRARLWPSPQVPPTLFPLSDTFDAPSSPSASPLCSSPPTCFISQSYLP